MEIGNEISQKIRSAIKAKLVDLGAYVDDELPDYIMVMVANKKSHDQMTEDLNLFLGQHTEKFTTWLHCLLSKLQAITAEPKKEPKPEAKKNETKRTLKSQPVNIPSEPQDVEQEVLQLVPEHDEFEEEERQRSKTKGKDKKPTKEKAKDTKSKRTVKSSREKDAKEKPKRDSSVEEKVVESKTISVQPGARKRHVVPEPRFESDEEDYQPRVASKVRVTERKSSVPESMQPPKTILLKAMTAAKTSIEKAKKINEQEMEGLQRKSVKSRVGSGGERSVKERLGRKDRRRKSDEQAASNRSSSRRSRDSSDEADQRRILTSTENSKVTRTEVERISQDTRHVTRKVAHGDEDDGDLRLEVSLPEEEELQGDIQNGGGISEDEIVTQSNSAAGPKFVVTMDGVDHEKYELDFDDEKVAVKEKAVAAVKPQVNMAETASVSAVDSDDDVEMVDMETTTLATIKERCKFWPSCSNGSECQYIHPNRQCSQFPNCKFGNRCLYVHPNCRFDAGCTNPSCAFTHTAPRVRAPGFMPQVIVQPIKVPIPMMMRQPRPSFPQRPPRPGLARCKFYPKCNNMNCPFNHPKPCKFGASCTAKATCYFLHPEMPTGDKLRWNKTTATSDRLFNAPTEKAMPVSVD